MKLRINRKTFDEALRLAQPFATRKTPIMALKYGKLTVKGNRAKLESNDGEGGIVKYMGLIEADEEGSFLVNVADMANFISRLKDEAVTIENEDAAVTVIHSKGKAIFGVESAEDYPSFILPQNDMTEIDVPSSVFNEYVNMGKKFISTETLRPMLTGIYFYAKEGKFGFCATDTHCLAHNETVSGLADDIDTHFLAMPNVYAAISAGCAQSDNVRISVTKGHVQYRFGDLIVQSTQAKGNYPDFNRVIPKDNPLYCIVVKNELADSLNRITLSCDASKCAKMSFTMFDMTLSVDNFEDAKKTVENVVHKECNGELKIGVNADMMLKLIKSLNSENIRMEMNDSFRPIVIKQDEMPNMTLLVMPMQLSNECQ